MIKFYMFFLMFAASAMDSGKIPSVWEMLRGHFGSDVCNSVERDVKEDGFYFCNFWGKDFEDENECLVALCYDVAFRSPAVRLEILRVSLSRIKYDNLHGLFLSLTRARNEASGIEDRFRIVHQILQKHTLEKNCKVRECEENLYEVIEGCYRGISGQFEYRIASEARLMIAQKEDIRWRESFDRLLKTLPTKKWIS